MEFTILNKKDNKLWKFVVEKIGHKTKLRIEIGADLTHRVICNFEDEWSFNLDKVDWKEFQEKIKENDNIFFMKMNFDNFKIYDKDINFLKIKSACFKLVNFVA